MNFGDPIHFSIIIFAMIGVFYFFMIRPQQKKAKQEERFVDRVEQRTKSRNNHRHPWQSGES